MSLLYLLVYLFIGFSTFYKVYQRYWHVDDSNDMAGLMVFFTCLLWWPVVWFVILVNKLRRQ